MLLLCGYKCQAIRLAGCIASPLSTLVHLEEHLTMMHPVNKRFPGQRGLMGIPPACVLVPFKDVCLKTAHAAKRLLPIFPLPRNLIQEKTVSLDIFHTLSVIFLAKGSEWAEIHQSYSHMTLSAAVSLHSSVQMVPSEACSEDGPTATQLITV